MQGKAIKEKYMNTKNINFNCNSGNLISINEKSEEEISKNDSLIFNKYNNVVRNERPLRNNNNQNFEKFQMIHDEKERKLYILNALKKNLELRNEQTKEEDDNLNILRNFNKIVDIKNKQEMLRDNNYQAFH